MEIFLLILYGAVLIAHIAMLVRVLKQPGKGRWTAHFLAEIGSVIASIALAFVFDGLRGVGIMPGLSYIMEFAYSLFAAAAYVVMLLVSTITWSVRKLFFK